MKQMIRGWLKGISNIWKWMPIIWKDRDWDDHFIWEILKFKIKNQSKYIGYHDRHMSAKRDAEIMMTCVRLIDRIQSEYYSSEHMDYSKNEYHFDPCVDKPGHSQLRIEEISERFDDYFNKYPRVYKQVMKMESAAFSRTTKSGIAINIAHENHNRAKKLLFKILEDNIERWWD